MTILEEREVTDWHGVCRSCGKVGDGHTLHCKTLRLKPGWILRVPMEFSGDPFEAAWEKAHAGR